MSSTLLDLGPERQAVEAAVQRMRETKFVGMEYFGSRDETTRGASLDEVDRCRLYLGIFGGCYGSGITEDEYRRALRLNLPCFIYFKKESAIPDAGREPVPENIERLGRLKQELRRTHTVKEFAEPAELAALVAADLHRWLADQSLSDAPLARPGAAPPLPPLIVGREEALRDLKACLGIVAGGGPAGAVQVLTVVRGWPGVVTGLDRHAIERERGLQEPSHALGDALLGDLRYASPCARAFMTAICAVARSAVRF